MQGFYIGKHWRFGFEVFTDYFQLGATLTISPHYLERIDLCVDIGFVHMVIGFYHR
jgi:hypothetical protein